MTDLKGRIALVTGASRGIGRAMALALAEAGAHIVAVARTEGALTDLDDAVRAKGATATLVPLDVRDGPGIDRLGAALYERYGKLDIFVGNAGVLGKLSPLGHVEPKVWDEVMAVNVTANWRFVRSLDPLLRRSDAGRAVFVTSGAATKCLAYWGPYSVSKAALEALARTWSAETVNTGMRVNLLNPGPIRTRMRAIAMPGEDPETLPLPETLARASLPLFDAGLADTGAVFDFRDGEVHRRG